MYLRQALVPCLIHAVHVAAVALAFSATLLAAVQGGPASADKRTVDEDQLKAGFLFNFARFVEWPASASGPLLIGAVADDAFIATLERVVRDRTIEGRPVVARRVREADDCAACHVLFISASWRGRSTNILSARQPILTVGESVQFLREGGIIRFYSEDNRIRFQISRENAAAAGLKISSHLLNLASR